MRRYSAASSLSTNDSITARVTLPLTTRRAETTRSRPSGRRECTTPTAAMSDSRCARDLPPLYILLVRDRRLARTRTPVSALRASSIRVRLIHRDDTVDHVGQVRLPV